MRKTVNQFGWLFVLPVVALVAFNAIIPLMTVVNYSVQESFGDNVFFWSGVRWFEEILNSEPLSRRAAAPDPVHRPSFWSSKSRSDLPSRSRCRARGPWVSVCLVLMALPLLIPWNVVGAMWNIMALPEIGLLGKAINALGITYNYTRQPIAAWFTVILMDVWHWTSLVVLLCYAGLVSIPDAYYQAAQDRRRPAVGGVPLYPAAEAQLCADHRHPAALHGQLHDLHRSRGVDRRRARATQPPSCRSTWSRRRSASSISARRRRCRSSIS